MNTELVTETTLVETVATEMFKLNYRRSTTKNAEKMAAEIVKFAQEILKITNTTARSWQMIYLEPADGSASHNPNQKVACDYKFLVYNKYGAQPIGLKTMENAL